MQYHTHISKFLQFLKARQACISKRSENNEDDKVNDDGDNGVGVVNYTNTGDDRCGVGVMIKVMITMMTMKKMKMVKVRMIKMKIDGHDEDVPLPHLPLGLSCEPSVGVEHPRV